MARAKPRTSSATTPLVRSAARTAPASAGGHCSLVRWMSSSPACDSVRSRRLNRISSISRMGGMPCSQGTLAHPARELQEILEQPRSFGRQDALRMKLHALDHQVPVPHAHDLSLRRATADLQGGWQGFRLGDQRMIATHFTGLRQAGEHRAAVMLNDGGLAMHAPSGAYHFAAEHLHDRLMSPADTQYRNAPGEGTDHVHRN